MYIAFMWHAALMRINAHRKITYYNSIQSLLVRNLALWITHNKDRYEDTGQKGNC
jgi:hypothetical protein